jgi:hypothetical protein
VWGNFFREVPPHSFQEPSGQIEHATKEKVSARSAFAKTLELEALAPTVFARTVGVQYERLATKIVKITRGTRVLACGENSHALHLVSELPSACSQNANLIP